MLCNFDFYWTHFSPSSHVRFNSTFAFHFVRNFLIKSLDLNLYENEKFLRWENSFATETMKQRTIKSRQVKKKGSTKHIKLGMRDPNESKNSGPTFHDVFCAAYPKIENAKDFKFSKHFPSPWIFFAEWMKVFLFDFYSSIHVPFCSEHKKRSLSYDFLVFIRSLL